MPLYKLTSANVRETTLVDCATGEVAYRTCTPSASGSSRSRASSIASWTGTSRSQEKLPQRNEPTTAILDHEGRIVAEIIWEGTHASEIRIQEEVLKGTSELFDAAFVRVLWVLLYFAVMYLGLNAATVRTKPSFQRVWSILGG